MMELVLNAEQARLVARANGNVKIIDDGGNRLGTIARPFALRSIAEKRLRRAPSAIVQRTTSGSGWRPCGVSDRRLAAA